MNNLAKTTLDGFDAIKAAHNLSENPDKLKSYYDQWSANYDRDVSSEEYIAPGFIAGFLEDLESNDDSGAVVDGSNRNINLLDAGCGTGLVGTVLGEKGYQKVDGFDLSDKMVEQARSTGAYRLLKAGIDLTKRNPVYRDDQYDAIVCCGVFTLGHVPPTALLELIRVTRPGGWIDPQELLRQQQFSASMRPVPAGN